MDILNEYSYIWDRDKEKYVLLDDETGKSIWFIGGKELMFSLIENDDLADLIIEKMLNAGNKVYNSIVELQEVIRISYIEGEV